MPKKISDETVKLIERLYKDNVSVADISKIAKVSDSTAYFYARVKPLKGFDSISDYNKSYY